ncbi:MAG: MmcQ/YjbR family DNA-binding protein [Treponema sp.]|jgi:predicted DNA-binding protein (MmcQ/YjbR family)|nr:MmcQ/YjbR family DNA-binding protein [Treponema sp.]
MCSCYFWEKPYRNAVLKFALKQYGTEPEYLWIALPNYAVLRHTDNKKWYAIVMAVPRNRLGMNGNDLIDLLNIKCDPYLNGSLRMAEGFLPAYHMNKENWITVLLDGSVDKKIIFSLLDMSFTMTGSRSAGKEKPGGNRDWIVPVNPKYYDIEFAFTKSENDTIIWKQSNSIAVGDIVYLYVAAPVSAIRYKCKTVEVNIPYHYEDSNVSMSRVMRIQLLERYDKVENAGVPGTVRRPGAAPMRLHKKKGPESG